ncbi:SDR family NAD(P)-dependent oxidoreductase [Halovenus marina]|uniref:SDR family NAD(P)-dependent oxidoreductase n=1 Tax=Halovenus marina TaxID=3396621 RepID=UPI003F556040
MHDHDLTGKTAIVTGGAGGTGVAICLALARCGADIVIAQRSKTGVDALTERIEELGSQAAYVETDLANDEDIVALVEATNERFGGPNIVVNNAVDPSKEPAATMSREYIDRTLAVNLVAPFRLAQEAYPHMLESGYGRIVYIGAIQAHSPWKGSATYAMAKAGLEGLVRSLTLEWADTNEADITANTLHVGEYRKGFERDESKPLEEQYGHVPPEEDADALTLVGRWGRTRDIANAVAFLASPASAFITGQSINCDGGRLISRKPAPQSHL